MTYQELREKGAGRVPAFFLTASSWWVVLAVLVAFLAIPGCSSPPADPWTKYHYGR